MNIFDAHCDTLYEVTFKGQTFRKNALNVDAERLFNLGGYTQIFAAWLENSENADFKFRKMADKLDEETEKNSDIIKKCTSYEDMCSARKEGKTAAFFSLEGAYQIEKAEDIEYIFSRGVRFINMTWNGANRLAGGVSSGSGLTELGRNALSEMERLGIIADVSHLNEKSFWDLTEAAKQPIIASHSNSKALCPHVRNLTDEQFKKIAELGGCVGINFYSDFLAEGKAADISDLVRHVNHFLDIGGEDHIGLGSDFDGVSRLPDGINGAEDMEMLANVFEKSFGGRRAEKIMHENFERIIKNLQ